MWKLQIEQLNKKNYFHPKKTFTSIDLVPLLLGVTKPPTNLELKVAGNVELKAKLVITAPVTMKLIMSETKQRAALVCARRKLVIGKTKSHHLKPLKSILGRVMALKFGACLKAPVIMSVGRKFSTGMLHTTHKPVDFPLREMEALRVYRPVFRLFYYALLWKP